MSPRPLLAALKLPLTIRWNDVPGEIIRAARSLLRGRPTGDQLGLRPSCRTRLVCLPGVRPRRRAGHDDEGFSSKESNGAPGEIRTPGLLVRSQALYPTELRARKGREYYHINQRAPFRRDLPPGPPWRAFPASSLPQ
jgi:hypothetical protein